MKIPLAVGIQRKDKKYILAALANVSKISM
jgi:hypothetical protein